MYGSGERNARCTGRRNGRCTGRGAHDVRVGGACGPPPPVAAPLASSLRAPSRGDPPLHSLGRIQAPVALGTYARPTWLSGHTPDDVALGTYARRRGSRDIRQTTWLSGH